MSNLVRSAFDRERGDTPETRAAFREAVCEAWEMSPEEYRTVIDQRLGLRPVARRMLQAGQVTSLRQDDDPDRGYVHSVLAQTSLPYRDPKTQIWDQNVYRHDGTFHCGITVQAGTVKTPDGRLQPIGLPFGGKARLILAWLTSRAVRTRSAEVEVPGSMSKLMKELGFTVTGGNRGSVLRFKQQLLRLSASHFRFSTTERGQDGVVVRHDNVDPITSFDLWFPSEPDRTMVWPTHVRLGQAFFDNLMAHAMPCDLVALTALSHNARAMDLFLWLSHRLRRVGRRRAKVSWEALYAQFGGGAQELWRWKPDFIKALKAVQVVYPNADVRVAEWGLSLGRSASPIGEK